MNAPSRGVLHCTLTLPALRLLTPSDRFEFFIRSARERWDRCSARTTPARERLVAVKLFKLDLPPERAHQLVAEFERLIAADLSHPAMAAPLATGISGVSAYLAQDYVAADSLDLVVREYGAGAAGRRAARRRAAGGRARFRRRGPGRRTARCIRATSCCRPTTRA